MADQEVSEAAVSYGRSMCLDPAREYLPLDQLTPDEVSCTMRVGRGFEAKVDAAFGAQPPAEGAVAFPVQTTAGRPVASLSMDGAGNVVLCIPDKGVCAPVGQGTAAAVAAEQTLALFGLQVAEG